jgi:hypothetical protein
MIVVCVTNQNVIGLRYIAGNESRIWHKLLSECWPNSWSSDVRVYHKGVILAFKNEARSAQILNSHIPGFGKMFLTIQLTVYGGEQGHEQDITLRTGFTRNIHGTASRLVAKRI